MWILLDRLGEILIIALVLNECRIGDRNLDTRRSTYQLSPNGNEGGISAPGGGTIIRGNFVNAAASL